MTPFSFGQFAFAVERTSENAEVGAVCLVADLIKFGAMNLIASLVAAVLWLTKQLPYPSLKPTLRAARWQMRLLWVRLHAAFDFLDLRRYI